MARFNDWWVTKRVRADLLKERRRPQFFKALDNMNGRHILLIMGLRQVGKTTIMYQLIDELLQRNVNESRILYFSFDDQPADIEDVLETYKSIVLRSTFGETGEKIYIFLDEVQKAGDWENKIKVNYDLYPNVKFVLSGSASVKIDKRSKESLAGRVVDLLMEPLSFMEFLEWKGMAFDAQRPELLKERVAPLFNDYLRKGGFPQIVYEENEDKIKTYIKNNIIDRIIFRDLPEEFRIRDTELLRILVGMVANNPGMILNYDSLSKDFKRSKVTIINYIHYLKYSLIIRELANYRRGFLISSRKMKKLYLNNTAIAYPLADDFYSDRFMEKIYENFAVIDTDAKNYYRNRYEIDIILKINGEIIPVEVKHGRVDTSPVVEFLRENCLKKAYILSSSALYKKTEKGLKIEVLPVWAFSMLMHRADHPAPQK